jgi:DNA-binding NarL/FixJ family response regulator
LSKRIKVLLVDDQSLFREALANLISSDPSIEVVGSATNGEEALRATVIHQPEVILMDLRMPVMDGVSATKRIKAQFPNVKVIALTTFNDDESVFDAIRAGAVGYLLKDSSKEELFHAISLAAENKYFLPPEITARVVKEFTRISKPKQKIETIQVNLTTRELEILKLIAEGISNKEIADRLVIAEGTVKNHISKILEKLNVNDRLQAILKAKNLGIIS